MREHVRIRREYVRLVRARKLDEAQKILEKIWDRKKTTNTKKPLVTKTPIITKEPVVSKTSSPKYTNLDDLTLIKGIGKKTVKDIKVMFVDLEDIKNALRDDRVALRDDVVEKLKEVLV